MAKEIGEGTKVTLDLKTIGIIGFGLATVIGMWFSLQADINEAKMLPEAEIQRMEFDMKDELIRQTIMDTQEDVESILEKLDKLFTKNKYEIRIVGGAVRDIALDKAPKDIDLATDATPIEMQRMFGQAQIRNKPTGIEHGTITAILDGENFEITTLRSDTNTDGRHAEVEFVRSWEEDAKRRDLTYNAMSLDFDGKYMITSMEWMIYKIKLVSLSVTLNNVLKKITCVYYATSVSKDVW